MRFWGQFPEIPLLIQLLLIKKSEGVRLIEATFFTGQIEVISFWGSLKGVEMTYQANIL